MKKTLILATLFFSTIVTAQSDLPSLIIGTWEFQEKIRDKEVETIDIFGNGSNDDKEDDLKHDELWFFQKNDTVDVRQFGEQYAFVYTLSDSALTVGESTYKVKQLTKDSLTLNEKGMFTDTDLIFTRSNQTIKPINPNEQVRTFYPSGQIKLSGQKVGGFQNGIWTEWYENGRVKSVTHYQRSVPFMIIEFDMQGKISSKSWYDLESRKMKSE